MHKSIIIIHTTESESTSSGKFSMLSKGILLTSLVALNVFSRSSSGVPCTNCLGKDLLTRKGVWPVEISCFSSSLTNVLSAWPNDCDWSENAVSKSFVSWHLEDNSACSVNAILSAERRWPSKSESKLDWEVRIADRASAVRDWRSEMWLEREPPIMWWLSLPFTSYHL